MSFRNVRRPHQKIQVNEVPERQVSVGEQGKHGPFVRNGQDSAGFEAL